MAPEPGTVAHASNLSTKQARQEDLEFRSLPEPQRTLSPNKKGKRKGTEKEGRRGEVDSLVQWTSKTVCYHYLKL